MNVISCSLIGQGCKQFSERKNILGFQLKSAFFTLILHSVILDMNVILTLRSSRPKSADPLGYYWPCASTGSTATLTNEPRYQGPRGAIAPGSWGGKMRDPGNKVETTHTSY